MRFFHHTDHARHRGIGGNTGDFHFQQSIAVERASEDIVAGALFNGNTLASNWALVNTACTGSNRSIHRYTFCGANAHQISKRNACYSYLSEFIASAYPCGLRGESSERPYGLARLTHGVVFQPVPEREEHQEHGALGVLTDRGCTQGGHRHEEVHIKMSAPKFA